MKPIPPWNNETNLFEPPNARCELVLDGQNHSVSVALWEDYCYLKVAGLKGLWAITRPYDNTDLAQFIAEQIQRGEVGKVWTFGFALMNFDYITQQYIDTEGALPLINQHTVPLVAIVRFDNSALVRTEDNSDFVETKPPHIKKKQQSKADIPSIWHPARKLIKRRQMAKLAQLALHPPLPTEELFAWKKGSLPEVVLLLETLYYYASQNRKEGYFAIVMDFYWPLERRNLMFPPHMMPKMEMTQFLQIIWNNYHYDEKNWLPIRGSYLTVTNKRSEWSRAESNQNVALRREVRMTAHERLEATMALHDLFKGKVSDDEINDLFREDV